MVHEGAKRPPLFPGFDRSAGQNESRKTWEQPAAGGSIHTEATIPRQLLLLPAEQRKGFRPLKNNCRRIKRRGGMVHEGAKRPPLFPGFDRSAGQNESEKPGNNQRPFQGYPLLF
ncbi:hypothetical protein KZX62_20755 [Paenibacillus silvae]|uniref:hypothetical protein n=1 Tax=Paenibacillus silvae TaxID=1325358 RepID=UPI002006A719|nr:hypothetical protein [Paenibacillus silvae]MCK6151665.1 hypothetical protein [Paenibacillus silvae]